MRLISWSIFLLLIVQSFGQKVPRTSHDFGKVKQWNNPIFQVSYTNTSGKDQMFLPIAYQYDVLVKFGNDKLRPGETTTISIQYFTEDFGRFTKEVDVFVTTQNEPIKFTIRGNIQSFHPDVFTICPRIDNSRLAENPQFIHLIRVVDADTKEPLSDFEVKLQTRYSSESFVSDKPIVSLKRSKPDFYQIEIDHLDYKIARRELYIARNTAETIIELVRETEPVNSDEFDFTAQEDIALNTPNEIEEVAEEIESNSDDEIEQKNPIITEEQEVDERVQPLVSLADSQDFTTEGTLSDIKYAYNHLVFLIDISGSMKHEDKLPLLKFSMYQMIAVLRPEDKVTIITYSTKAKVLIAGISGANKTELNNAVKQLWAQGQSYGKEGLDMAYETALSNFIVDGNNEIILASDGVFNSKGLNKNKLEREVSKQSRDHNILLSSIGFGKSKLALSFLEDLATKGDGSFIKINNEKQAETVLIENLMKHSLKNK